jgi:small-conductance mechanosensitive channel
VLLETSLYNNTIQQWLIAAGIAILSLIVIRILRGIIFHRLRAISEKTATELDDLITDLVYRTKFFLLLAVAIYIGSLALSLPQTMKDVITKVVIIAILAQGAIWGSGLITFWINRYKKQKIEEGDTATATTFTALNFILKLTLWSVIVLLTLDNLGFDVTALVAGLGVGGVAVALAVQSILGDLFASLSIVLDKPFVIGDFIIVDDYLGTVEHIGLKTTRIRSLSGEQLVFSNADLLNSRIRNFKRMFERRVVFTIGVTYQTPLEKLEIIPKIIREIIESKELTRFDRSHFKEYGDFSLNFETVYWVLQPDYNTYMDIHQSINLEIYKRFAEEGIEFAYPTQTLFIQKEDAEYLSDSR